MIKKLKSFVILFIIGVCFFGCQPKQNKAVWTPIFNDKDLNDWQIKISGHPLGENYNNTFRVVDGKMQVNYDYYESFGTSYGHIFYKNPYSTYKLRFQYRFFGEQANDGAEWATKNSGVMLHCQNPESMELNQYFPVSIEVQLLGGMDKGERPTANVCTPGTHIVMENETVTTHCIESTSKTFRGDQWVNVEILVKGNELISHKINGEKVLTYSKPTIGGRVENVKDDVWAAKQGAALKSGYIAFQSESHPVEYKNIEILELK